MEGGNVGILRPILVSLGINPEEVSGNILGFFDYMKKLAELQEENNKILEYLKNECYIQKLQTKELLDVWRNIADILVETIREGKEHDELVKMRLGEKPDA